MATITLNIQLSGASALLSGGLLKDINDNLRIASQGIGTLNNSLGATNTALGGVAQALAGLTQKQLPQFQQQGQQAADQLQRAYERLANVIGKGVGEALQQGVTQFESFNKAAMTMATGVQSGLKQAVGGFTSFFTTLGGGGLGGIFSGATTIITSTLQGLVGYSIDAVKQITGAFGGALDSLGTLGFAMGKGILGSVATALGSIVPVIGNALGAAASVFGQAVGGVIELGGAIASAIADSVGLALKGALVSAVFTAYKSVSEGGKFEALRPSFAKLVIPTVDKKTNEPISEEAQQAQLQDILGGNEQPIIDGLKKLRAATRGTISDVELMANANRAAALGAAKDADEFGKLANAALNLSRTMGIDAKYALESLTLGIGRQSRLILDNLGIMLKVSDVNEQYARSIGKSSAALTDQEKKTALVNEVFRQAQGRLAGLDSSSQTASEAFSATGAAFSNMTTSLGRTLLPLFQTVMSGIGGVLARVTERIEDLLKKLKPIIENLSKQIKPLFDDVIRFLTNLTSDDIVFFYETIRDQVVSFFENLPQLGTKAVESIKQSIKDFAPTLNSYLKTAFETAITAIKWTAEQFKPLADAVGAAVSSTIKEYTGFTPGQITFGAGAASVAGTAAEGYTIYKLIQALKAAPLPGGGPPPPPPPPPGGFFGSLAGLGRFAMNPYVLGGAAIIGLGAYAYSQYETDEEYEARRTKEKRETQERIRREVDEEMAKTAAKEFETQQFMQKLEDKRKEIMARHFADEQAAVAKAEAVKLKALEERAKFVEAQTQSTKDAGRYALQKYVESVAAGSGLTPEAYAAQNKSLTSGTRLTVRTQESIEAGQEGITEIINIAGSQAAFAEDAKAFMDGVRKAVQLATGVEYDDVIKLGIDPSKIISDLLSSSGDGIRKSLREGKPSQEAKERIEDIISMAAASTKEDLTKGAKEALKRLDTKEVGEAKATFKDAVAEAERQKVNAARDEIKAMKERLRGLEKAADVQDRLADIDRELVEEKKAIREAYQAEKALIEKRYEAMAREAEGVLRGQQAGAFGEATQFGTLLPIAKAFEKQNKEAQRINREAQRGAFPGMTSDEIAALPRSEINRRVAESLQETLLRRGASTTPTGQPLYGELTTALKQQQKADRDAAKAREAYDKARLNQGYGEASLEARRKEAEQASKKAKDAAKKVDEALTAEPGFLETLGGEAAKKYEEARRKLEKEKEIADAETDMGKKIDEATKAAEKAREKALETLKSLARTLDLSIDDLLKNWRDHEKLKAEIEESERKLRDRKAAPVFSGTTKPSMEYSAYVAPITGGTTPGLGGSDYGANGTIIGLLRQIRDCVCTCCPSPTTGGATPRPPTGGTTPGGGGVPGATPTPPLPPGSPQGGGTTPGLGREYPNANVFMTTTGMLSSTPNPNVDYSRQLSSFIEEEASARRSVASETAALGRGMETQIDILSDINDGLADYARRSSQNQRGVVRSLDTTNKTIGRMIAVEEGLAGNIRGLSSDAAALYNRLGNLEVAVFRARGGFGAVDLLRVRSTGASIGAYAPTSGGGGGYYTAG